MTFAVGIGGRIGAGKSTLAECLARHLGAPVVGFGTAVRAEAARRGIDQNRTSLQGLGQSMLESLGAEKFILLAMREAGIEPTALPLIVEGVRHVSIYEALSNLVAPNRLYLVYVDVPDQIRRERLLDSGVEADQIRSFDSHATELDVTTKLRSMADYVVSSFEGDTACEEVVRWVVTQGAEQTGGS